MQDTLFKTSYITENAAQKAVVATGGTALQVLIAHACSSNVYANASCQVVGGLSALVKILLGMMVLDLITGVMASRCDGERISSRRLGSGMKRKVAMFAVIASAALLEEVFRQTAGLDMNGLLHKWTTCWFIAVEALSLYENASRMGLRMPDFLKATMERLLQKADIEGEAMAKDASLESTPATNTQEQPK